MQHHTIRTNRLTLVLTEPRTLDYIFDECTIAEQLDFLGLDDLVALEKEKQRHLKGNTTHNKSFTYFQLRLTATKKVIGWCGYHTWYTDHRRAELGYGLYADDYKRQGLMSEALAAILVYGFETMDLNRVEAFTSLTNNASINTLQKFDFVKEGVLKEHYINNGQAPEDSLLFALLKSQFKLQ